MWNRWIVQTGLVSPAHEKSSSSISRSGRGKISKSSRIFLSSSQQSQKSNAVPIFYLLARDFILGEETPVDADLDGRVQSIRTSLQEGPSDLLAIPGNQVFYQLRDRFSLKAVTMASFRKKVINQGEADELNLYDHFILSNSDYFHHLDRITTKSPQPPFTKGRIKEKDCKTTLFPEWGRVRMIHSTP